MRSKEFTRVIPQKPQSKCVAVELLIFDCFGRTDLSFKPSNLLPLNTCGKNSLIRSKSFCDSSVVSHMHLWLFLTSGKCSHLNKINILERYSQQNIALQLLSLNVFSNSAHASYDTNHSLSPSSLHKGRLISFLFRHLNEIFALLKPKFHKHCIINWMIFLTSFV